MDDASLQRVCGLAASLRHSAHLLLDRKHKLSLDTWTLGEVLAAFSLILEVEQHTNFHVLPLNHRLHPAIPHLQFIYDLLQKIPGLRLWAKEGLSIPPESVPLSVRCFRSVVWLEVSHVPISQIKALQTLRPSLRSITVVRGITSLAELFIQCGADNAGEFAWESLQEAVLSHNILHSLDSSLALLTSLKVLDLSHCELRDVSALSHLPCVTFLDLSHNQLTSLPPLSPTAATSLTLLTINNNFITQLAGLEEMSNLEELDVQGNLLSFLGVLGVLGALPHLRVLTLVDNPLVFHPSYRTRVITMLNPATANKEMILDGEPLNAQEHSSVGSSAVVTSFSYSPELLSSLSALPTTVHTTLPTPISPSQPVFSLDPPEPEGLQGDTVDSQPPSLVQGSFTSLSRSTGNGPSRRRSKKKRTRHIAIADPDGDKDGEGSMYKGDEPGLDSVMGSSLGAFPQPPPPSLVAPSTLQPSGALEDTINFAALALKAGMSSPGAEQSDRLLEEILQSKPQTGTPVSSLSQPPNLVTDSQKPTKGSGESGQENIVSKGEGKKILEEKRAEQEERKNEERQEPLTEATSPETSFYSRRTNLSQESSVNASPDSSDSEGEDDEAGDVYRVLAQREVVLVGEQEISLQDVILAVTETHFKEKHGITTRTLFRWDLVTLESMETLLAEQPFVRLLLTFNTIRPAYKTRTYSLAQEDYQSLEAVLSPVLERNTLKAVLHSAMECRRCQAQFSLDLARSSQVCDALRCPNCGGGVVVRADGLDHPAITSSTPISYSPGPPALQDSPPGLPSGLMYTPVHLIHNSPPHNAQTVTGIAEGQGESSESVSVCSDVSARRESDVEVISNPSISSIEVLADQLIIQDVIPEEGLVGGTDGGRGLLQRNLGPPPPAVVNSDARTPPLAPSPTTPHMQQDPPTSSNMQESSSSGSMTGSICTTYERPGSLPTSPLRLPAPQPNTQAPITSAEDSSSDSSNVMYQTAESSLDGEMLNRTSTTATIVTTPTTTTASPHASPSTSPVLSSSCTSIDTVKNGNSGSSEGLKNRMSTAENGKRLHNKGVMTSMREEGEDEEQGGGGIGDRYNLASWVQSLLHTLTGYYWVWWEEVPEAEGKVERASNPVLFSYEDFARVDHRLKLHCDVVLFHEQQEELLGLVKAVLLVRGGRREFQGLLVISTKKLYILEIVSPEDDSPQSWLELQSSHSLSEVSSLHSLYQRQGLALSLPDSLILVSLADSHRANCLFNFLSEVLDEHGLSPNIEESSPAQEAALSRLVSEAVGGSASGATPSVFAIVSILLEGGCSESQFLVVTETDLVLFHADLTWYLPPSPPSDLILPLNHTQKIANITTIEVGSASHIGLQFLDEVSGEESSWDLHVASPVAACHIIQAIRTPWSHLFSVDLQEFIGVYRSQEGDVLTVTRINIDEEEEDTDHTIPPSVKGTKTAENDSINTKETVKQRDDEVKNKLQLAADVRRDKPVKIHKQYPPEDWLFESPIKAEGKQKTDIRKEKGKQLAGILEERRDQEKQMCTDIGEWEETKTNIWGEKLKNRKEKKEDGKESLDMDTEPPKPEEDEWYEVAAVATRLKYDPKYPILGYSDQHIPTLVTSDEKGEV